MIIIAIALLLIQPPSSATVSGRVDLSQARIMADSPVFATSPLQRLEIGIGKKITRSVVGKLTFSRGWNEVDDLQDNVLGAQLSLGF